MSLTHKELKQRAATIGCSELASAMGLNPHESAYDLFKKKTEPPTPNKKQNQPAHWGHKLELYIAHEYHIRTGYNVTRHNQKLQKGQLTGHVDYLIKNQKRGMDCKNVGPNTAPLFGEPGTDQIPVYYLPQMHGYLYLMDYETWDVAVLINGQDFRIYTIERDHEWDDLIGLKVAEFMHHLNNDIRPPLDLSHPTIDKTLELAYAGTDGSIVHLDQIEHWHQVLTDSNEIINKYTKAAQTAKTHIKAFMKQSAIGILPDGTYYKRRQITRKAYKVSPSQYMELKHINRQLKEQK